MSKKQLRVAAADIGSNNLHFTVAECDQGELRIITRHEIPTRLSEDVDDDGRVSPTKMAEVAALLNLFKAIGESYYVENFLCIATEATRAANNAEQFLSFLHDRTGLHVQVISGEVEAALTFRGATYDRKLHIGQLVVDIGGGSTELIAANRHHVDWLMTVPIGSARMRERFIQSDPPKKKELAKLDRFLDHVFHQVVPDHEISDVIFTGGSATHLYHLAARDRGRWRLKRKDVNAARRRLRRDPAWKIARWYQMDLARAETLAAGISIVRAILKRFELDSLRISPQGLRSGLILAFAQYGDEWMKHLVPPDIVRAPSPLDLSGEA